MELHELLRELIDKKGLKHSFVANKVGLDKQVISQILNGRRKIKQEELFEILRCLNISPKELNEMLKN